MAFNGEKIMATAIIPTGWSPKESGNRLLEEILNKSQLTLDEVHAIVGTGYGRVSLDFINKKVTEITCHGRGAHFINPEIRTVIDIGGQDSKVIRLNESGLVMDFLMNDKCAAGTGRFLQVMANTMEMDVSQLSETAGDAKPENINSMCTVFAESEVISLMAEGASKESIAAGLLQSVCNKTYSLVSRVGAEDQVFFSGGVSQNPLLKKYLSDKLGVEIQVSDLSQFIGAIGAAIIAYEL